MTDRPKPRHLQARQPESFATRAGHAFGRARRHAQQDRLDRQDLLVLAGGAAVAAAATGIVVGVTKEVLFRGNPDSTSSQSNNSGETVHVSGYSPDYLEAHYRDLFLSGQRVAIVHIPGMHIDAKVLSGQLMYAQMEGKEVKPYYLNDHNFLTGVIQSSADLQQNSGFPLVVAASNDAATTMMKRVSEKQPFVLPNEALVGRVVSIQSIPPNDTIQANSSAAFLIEAIGTLDATTT